MTFGSPLLSAIPGLRHAFFTREGGVSGGIYAEPQWRPRFERRSRQCRGKSPPDGRADGRHAGAFSQRATRSIRPTRSWRPDHGTATPRPRADAIVTRTEGLAIGVTAADCGPILFADAGARVIGAAHAGWKGALTGVLESTIDAMEKLGADRSGIVAAIGPLIRQHSYEVGGEFVERFLEADAENAAFFIPSARDQAMRCSTSPASSACGWKMPAC